MYLTTGKAARICGVHVNTIKGWIRKGALPAKLMPSGRWRISRKAFLHFLQEYDFPVPDELCRKADMPRILVVDDDPFILDFVEGAIANAPFANEVYKADDGYSALLKIGHIKPQLLVLDIMMPGINGLELIHRLREQSELTGDMRILVLTGAKDRRLVMQKLKEARPDEILFKPTNVEQLLGAATRLLDKNKVKTEREGSPHARSK